MKITNHPIFYFSAALFLLFVCITSFFGPSTSPSPVQEPFRGHVLEPFDWENGFGDSSDSFQENAFIRDLSLNVVPTRVFLPTSRSSFPRQVLFTVRRTQGQLVGCDSNYTTLEMLSFPFRYCSYWPFLDLRAHCLDQGGFFAGNIGLGCRFASRSMNQILGVNIYYDCRNAHHVCFDQMGVGLEVLGCRCSLRMNAYFPVGPKRVLEDSCFSIDEPTGYFSLKETFLNPLKGIDFEAESLIMNTCWARSYFAIGGYYYQRKCCLGDIYGSSYRFSTTFCNYFSLDVIGTYDNGFKGNIQAQFSFTIPLYRVSCAESRLFQRVRRLDMIVLKKNNWWTWNW